MFIATIGNQGTSRISAISDQGIRNNTQEEAVKMSGENPDFGITDLWDAIESGNFPSWTVYFQAMNATQAEKFKCKPNNASTTGFSTQRFGQTTSLT